MKAMFRFFFFLYAFAPLIVVPLIAYKEDDWYILLGAFFSYLGVFLAATKPAIFYGLTLFCIGFWVRRGFSIHQYVTLFFFLLLAGFMFYRMAEQYDQLSKRGTLENDKELLQFLEQNPNYLTDKMRKWQEDNPGKELTYDVIDALAKGRNI